MSWNSLLPAGSTSASASGPSMTSGRLVNTAACFFRGTKTIVTFYGPDVDSSRSASFDGARPNQASWNPACHKSSPR